jgi:MoaA/NifB/PqqE/SkfB family radical SAM enzyme
MNYERSARGAMPVPTTSSYRGSLPDERCRFRPLECTGLRAVVRLTYRCDLMCSHCLVGKRTEYSELVLPDWKRILVALSAIGVRKVLLTGGEPLLHPALVDLVRFVSAQGIPVDLNSNLQRMTPCLLKDLRHAGLTEISVSIEGPATVHDAMHGKVGAFAQTLRAIHWAAERDIQIDVSCCLTTTNVPYLPELFAMLEAMPLQSFTVSRAYPVGHARDSGCTTLREAELAAVHADLVRHWLPRARFPVRLVGLLGLPRPADCGRGESLIGLTPQGEVVACVLAAQNPRGVPHPLSVGLDVAVARMRAQLHDGVYALCSGGSS